jgi:5-methylcytosine-specific restriction protein A
MNSETVKFAKEIIQQRIGLSLNGEIISGKNAELRLYPADIHPNESFFVSFFPGWRTAKTEFTPGKFSAQLISQMGKAGDENRNVFFTLANALDRHKAKIVFRVNGIECSLDNDSNWPETWQKIELQISSVPQVINADDAEQMKHLIIELVVPMFTMFVALIGAEETPSPATGELEGAAYQTMATKYERKKINREACIQLKGTRCTVCGLDFSEYYGQIGEGYIEVHHTTPVSMLGPDYRINILTDLEPLCANCHAMVHRQTPPIPSETLIKLIKDKNGEIIK